MTQPEMTTITAQVLATLIDPDRTDFRLSEVARIVKITERTAQAVVATLVRDGYIRRAREGRLNRYEATTDAVATFAEMTRKYRAAADDVWESAFYFRSLQQTQNAGVG